MVLSLRTGREDGIDVLCAQHQTIRGLVDTVIQGQVLDRRRAFDLLCSNLASHEAAESLLLRPVTRSCVLGGEVIADSRNAEERHAKQAVEELARLDIESHEFRRAFGDFARQLLEHFESEETYEFPLVRAYRDEDALAALGTVLRRADPGLPESVLRSSAALAGAVMSPLASAVGKVRDAVAIARP
jgi:hypothetical protein